MEEHPNPSSDTFNPVEPKVYNSLLFKWLLLIISFSTLPSISTGAGRSKKCRTVGAISIIFLSSSCSKVYIFPLAIIKPYV
jgi:hypothetical protein